MSLPSSQVFKSLFYFGKVCLECRKRGVGCSRFLIRNNELPNILFSKNRRPNKNLSHLYKTKRGLSTRDIYFPFFPKCLFIWRLDTPRIMSSGDFELFSSNLF